VAVFVGPRFAPFGWYGPAYGPYPYGPYAVAPNAGQVKIETKVKDAQVFVNGSYAGTAGKLKTMWLRPGTYTIELRAPGLPRYAEKIYVVGGKKIVLNPELRPVPTP
jgi:PEGA domain